MKSLAHSHSLPWCSYKAVYGLRPIAPLTNQQTLQASTIATCASYSTTSKEATAIRTCAAYVLLVGKPDSIISKDIDRSIYQKKWRAVTGEGFGNEHCLVAPYSWSYGIEWWLFRWRWGDRRSVLMGLLTVIADMRVKERFRLGYFCDGDSKIILGFVRKFTVLRFLMALRWYFVNERFFRKCDRYAVYMLIWCSFLMVCVTRINFVIVIAKSFCTTH